MKFALISLLLTLPMVASAAVQPYYQDIKLPTQKVIERQSILNPAASTTNSVKSAYAGATSAAAVVLTSFAAQPDVPRNLNITPAGTTGDVEACVINVVGTDINDNSIQEYFTFAANDAARVDGHKAFKTVTSVTWPANCESGSFGATWSIGYGEKIGLKRCMDSTGWVFHSSLNGVKEGTAPTLVYNEDVVSYNTADFNGTMNGTSDFEIFFMQNYRCLR